MAEVNQPLAQPDEQAADAAPAMPENECTLKVPEEIEREIPQVLVWTGRCRTADQYVALVKSAYKLLRIKRVTLNGEAQNFLNFGFIGADPQILGGVKASTPDLANVGANVIGLNGLLTTITSGDSSYSSLRQVKPNCVEAFTNANVNTQLVELCQQESDDNTAQDYLYTLLVERFIPLCQKSILFLHKKARMGVEFFYEIEHLKQDIAKLKNDYHLMLTSLQNRSAVNELLFHCMSTKKKAMDSLKAYAKFWEEDSFQHCKSIFEPKLNVYHDIVFFDESDAPDDNNITSWIAQKTLYSNLVKAPTVKPETLSVFKQITVDIDPIIGGVRSFTPTPLELAQEKAVYMKTSVLRIRKDAENFLKPESEKTIGKARSLLEQIKSIRGAIDNLQLSGLVINHETVGLTQVELEDFYVKISNTLAQKEYEAKVNEAKQRAADNELAKGAPQLQLPPLNGFSSWLNFRRAINDIMPLHSNHLIKKQILLKSLKNKEDHSRCQSMDYEDGFKYLVQRYESSALIPGLIDELLQLTPASSDRQAYENLTQLISTTSVIQSYDQIDKLDSNARSKLTYILLSRELQISFLKDQFQYEDELKKSERPDFNFNDLESMSDGFWQTPEVEVKRRDFWLESMKTFLYISRELTKNEDSLSKKTKKGTSEYRCVLCDKTHKHKGVIMLSLSQCPDFKKLDVPHRIGVLDSEGFCKVCLRDKSDGLHLNGCTVGRERKILCNKCKPPSSSHHPMIHWEKENTNESNFFSNPDDEDYDGKCDEESDENIQEDLN